MEKEENKQERMLNCINNGGWGGGRKQIQNEVQF